jgi:hypothetical protein
MRIHVFSPLMYGFELGHTRTYEFSRQVRTFVDIIDVASFPGVSASGLVGELWEGHYLLVCDQSDNAQPHGRVLKIDPRTHSVITLFSGLAFPHGFAEDRHGNFYVTDPVRGEFQCHLCGRSPHTALGCNIGRQPSSRAAPITDYYVVFWGPGGVLGSSITCPHSCAAGNCRNWLP